MYRLAEELLSDLSPDDLPVLSVAMRQFYASSATQGRMVASVALWSRRQRATAFDDRLGSLALQLTLVVLNGIATGAFEDLARQRGPRWWRDWRLARRLRRRAPAGANTRVPVLAQDRAVSLAETTRHLATRAGLSAEGAAAFTAGVARALTGPAVAGPDTPAAEAPPDAAGR